MLNPLEEQVGGDHYKTLGIQPIEYIYANKLDWCEANIVKYITRHRQKGKEADLDKVIHYAQLEKELVYGKDKNDENYCLDFEGQGN